MTSAAATAVWTKLDKLGCLGRFARFSGRPELSSGDKLDLMPVEVSMEVVE